MENVIVRGNFMFTCYNGKLVTVHCGHPDMPEDVREFVMMLDVSHIPSMIAGLSAVMKESKKKPKRSTRGTRSSNRSKR